MKVGDLVRAGDPSSAPGIILETGIGPGSEWVLVLWPEEYYGLCKEQMGNLEVVSEGR